MVGATPEVIRKHYEKMDRMMIAKRAVERRLAANPTAPIFARPLRAGQEGALDGEPKKAQAVGA